MKVLCRSLLRVSVLCATLLTTVVAYAQTASVLQGTVTDRNTGAPLAGASVSRCGSTVTDGNGNYALTAQDLCNQGSRNHAVPQNRHGDSGWTV